MCNRSESIAALAKALAAFQGEVRDPSKGSDNPFFKSKYVSLDGLVAAVRPVLSRHGLSYLQFPGGDGQLVTMRTMLLHESGEWIESDVLAMRPVKADPQGVGSAQTYARRYQLQAVLGVAWEPDDDGSAASKPAPEPIRPAPPPMQPDDGAEKKRLAQELMKESREKGITSKEIGDMIRRVFRKDRFEQLTLDEARKLRENYEGFLHDIYKARESGAA